MKPRNRQESLETTLPIGSLERAQLRNSLKPRIVHGGPPSVGVRKTTRPWNSSAPVHLVLKSTRAKKTWWLLHRKHQSKIQSMIYRYAERFRVRVFVAKNAGNEIHLLVKAHDRKALADYLRVLAGRVAVSVTGAQKGLKKVGKFWDTLVWSRLVNWGADFFGVRNLIQKLPPTHVGVLDTLVSDFSLGSVTRPRPSIPI